MLTEVKSKESGERRWFKCEVPDRWTVEPGFYYLGNKFHPCAVLVPLDDDVGKEIVRHAVDMGVAIAGFCKTANIGIEKVICNVLANPNIRYLIVAGHESPGHRSGKAIINLCRHGVDPRTGRILCGPNRPCDDVPTGYVPNLPLEAIERFREQVTVIDLLIDGREVREDNVLQLLAEVVRACIQEPENRVRMTIKGVEYELYDPGARYDKPYVVRITHDARGAHVETLSDYHATIVARSIADAYRETLGLIRGLGREVVTHYGKTRELLNVTIHVLDPLVDEIPSEYPLKSRDYIERYCKALIRGERVEGFEYSYGERLHKHDQLNKAVERIAKDPTTRQCVVSIWMPEDLESSTPPCITHVQLIIRDGRLHVVAFLRSHDFERAFVHNAFGLREVMLYVINKLRERGVLVEPGTLTMHITSCHVYI